jgi:hypothetical protein
MKIATGNRRTVETTVSWKKSQGQLISPSREISDEELNDPDANSPDSSSPASDKEKQLKPAASKQEGAARSIGCRSCLDRMNQGHNTRKIRPRPASIAMTSIVTNIGIFMGCLHPEISGSCFFEIAGHQSFQLSSCTLFQHCEVAQGV